MEMYGTSVFAGRVPCSEGTARELDRRGIIKPKRTKAGQRRFDDEDVKKAQEYLGRIGRLRLGA